MLRKLTSKKRIALEKRIAPANRRTGESSHRKRTRDRLLANIKMPDDTVAVLKSEIFIKTPANHLIKFEHDMF
jgi:hypothetical protein